MLKTYLDRAENVLANQYIGTVQAIFIKQQSKCCENTALILYFLQCNILGLQINRVN